MTLLVLRLLRERFAHVEQTFTAVATAGSASGALLGAAKLSYRLFGAAIRESTALLEAAPRTPFGDPRCAAFASDAFRRLLDYADARPLATHGVSKPAMSTALRSATGAVADAPTTAASDVGVFSGRLIWRVRGVGAASVSCVSLD
jgi:hypothetical protein